MFLDFVRLCSMTANLYQIEKKQESVLSASKFCGRYFLIDSNKSPMLWMYERASRISSVLTGMFPLTFKSFSHFYFILFKSWTFSHNLRNSSSSYFGNRCDSSCFENAFLFVFLLSSFKYFLTSSYSWIWSWIWTKICLTSRLSFSKSFPTSTLFY